MHTYYPLTNCPSYPINHPIVLRCFPNTPLKPDTMLTTIFPKLLPIFSPIICAYTFQLALDRGNSILDSLLCESLVSFHFPSPKWFSYPSSSSIAAEMIFNQISGTCLTSLNTSLRPRLHPLCQQPLSHRGLPF